MSDHKLGDLFRVTKEMFIRKDGLAFGRADCDEEGKIPKDWLVGADELLIGTLCGFLRDGDEDPDYGLFARDMVGRLIFIRFDHLEKVATIDDAEDGDA